MKKKIIALLLCVCLISATCIQPAYAVGAEGIIVGGGAAAGVTLTLPQVALIVAAGYGLVYAAQHAEEIADGLNTALTNAANNVADGLEVLSGWKDNALKGLISLSSAPAWIGEAVKGWVSGLYESKDVPNTGDASFVPTLPAGETIPGVVPINSQTFSATEDVTVVRFGSCKKQNINGTNYYNISFYLYAISSVSFQAGQGSSLSNSIKGNVDGTTYYYLNTSSGSSVPADTPLAGYNLQMYEAANSLPSYDDFLSVYTEEYTIQKLVHALADGYFDGLAGGSVCPDTVGGIGNAVEEHGIDNINVPDMNIGASGLLAPDVVGDGSIDDVLNDVLTRLKEQDLAWSDYVADVGVGNPSVSIPQEDGTTLDFPITDVGVGDEPIDPPADYEQGLDPYTMHLSDLFPFCIPFDIADFVSVLCAEPEAPSYEWEFTWYDGSKDTLLIDLSPFDEVAQLLRNMELLLFCISLALITRNLIRG